MPWWGWVLIALLVLVALLELGVWLEAKLNRRADPITETISDLVMSVNTLEDYHALESRCKESKRFQRHRFHDYWNSYIAMRNSEILEEAVSRVGEKVLSWQYMPPLELSTTSKALDNVGKVYSLSEYASIKGTFGDTSADWYGLRAYDEPEEPYTCLPVLKKFRAIVEQESTQDHVISSINELLIDEMDFKEEFFGSDDLSPGEEWFANMLSEKGLPRAERAGKDLDEI